MTYKNPIVPLLAFLAFIVPVDVNAAPNFGQISALAPSRDGVLVASDRGLFVAMPDGRVERRAERDGGFTALAADKSSADLFYASGRRGGLLRSSDGGRHWQNLSPTGPDSFTILAAGPSILYGVAEALYESSDGGKIWRRIGFAPDKLMSLAVAAKNPRLLYAGTMAGLMRSSDGGRHWNQAAVGPALHFPVTLISAGSDGSLFRFDWGRGLLRARKTDSSWEPLNNNFGGQAILHLVRQGNVLAASTDAAKLFVSRDGGRRWQPLGGYPRPSTDAARRGEKLFTADCQVCHGDHGIGEAPKANGGQQSLAPALDETAHAWHHNDDQLVDTILHGLPAPSRMVGWSGRLKENDVQDIVAYIKSLWTTRAVSCQGPRHMDPDCRN